MTVTYSADVNTIRFNTFVKLLFKWKGSMWKAVYQEFFFWLFLYILTALIYHKLLTEPEKRIFEELAVFVSKYTDFIPLTFMLGFFINVIVSRWWTMYMNMGWIDIPALYVCNYIVGTDEYARLLRRTIVRFLLFYQVLVYRDISEVIRRRFPTLNTLVPAGYVTESELRHLTAITSKCKKYWVPINWAMNVVRRARREKRIDCDHAQQDIFRVIIDFRKKLQLLIRYDYAPVPLVYTQVVCLTVRLYFCLALICRQHLEASPDPAYLQPIDMYVPLLSMFQFLFYMGWLKVAEVLMNPFGDDDDDFEINWLIDRNLRVGLTIADEIWEIPLVRDAFWTTRAPDPLYSVDTVRERYNPQVGSASNLLALKTRRTSVQMIPRISWNENEEERAIDSESHQGSPPISFGAFRRKLSQLTSRVSSTNDLESARSVDHDELHSKGGTQKIFAEQAAEIIEILQQQSDALKARSPTTTPVSSCSAISTRQHSILSNQKHELDIVEEEESDESRNTSNQTTLIINSNNAIIDALRKHSQQMDIIHGWKQRVDSDADDESQQQHAPIDSQRVDSESHSATFSDPSPQTIDTSSDSDETEFESAEESLNDEVACEALQRSQSDILEIPLTKPHLIVKIDSSK